MIPRSDRVVARISRTLGAWEWEEGRLRGEATTQRVGQAENDETDWTGKFHFFIIK